MSTTLQELSSKQKAAIRRSEDKPFVLYDGSIRSGKTVGSLLDWAYFVADGPEGNLAMIGKTERTLKHNVLDLLVDLLGEESIKITAGSGEAEIFGRRAYLFGANDERSVDKIKGVTLTGLYGDQVETWPESFFRMAVSRLSVEGAKFIGTSNPEGPRHYLKTDYIDRRDEEALGVEWIHFTLDDNPYLPERYKVALRLANPGLWGKRYIDGLWVAAEGAIYDTLSEDVHIVGASQCPVSKLPRMLSWWIGIDYGTSAPFVALLIGEGIDKRLYVLDEWRWDSSKEHAQKTDVEYSRALLKWLLDLELYRANPRTGDLEEWLYERISVDPSATSFIAQLWADDFPRAGKASAYSVADGLRALSSLFSERKLLFAPGMEKSGTWGELTQYIWDPKAQEIGVDRPLKKDDHGPDGLRYGIMSARPVWRDWIAWEPREEEEEPGDVQAH